MQKRDFPRATPVAPVKRLFADDVERPGNRNAVLHRKNQQQFARHFLMQQVKGGAGQIRLAPFSHPGVLIKFPEIVPMLGLDVVPRQMNDLHVFLGLDPFPADSLAFPGR